MKPVIAPAAFLLLCSVTSLTGCSMAMALSGHPEPNFDSIKVGATREEIEFDMGKPASVQTLGDGKQEATYKYEMGNTVNAGRAAMWGYAWLTIIGILGEPIYDIIELMQGHDEETKVVYDSSDRAIEITGYLPPPMAPEMKAAQEEQETYVRKRPPPRSDQPSQPSSTSSPQGANPPCANC